MVEEEEIEEVEEEEEKDEQEEKEDEEEEEEEEEDKNDKDEEEEKRSRRTRQSPDSVSPTCDQYECPHRASLTQVLVALGTIKVELRRYFTLIIFREIAQRVHANPSNDNFRPHGKH